MSDHQTEATSKPAARTVVNPYAQKKKTSPPKQNSAVSTNGGALFVAPAAAEVPPVSFSQAFSSVEETQYYQNEMANWMSDNNRPQVDETEAAERAQQRAFDANLASEVGATTPAASQENVSARDQHAMLQPHILHVSTKQRGNGVLKFIRNVAFSYSNMVPDYIMSSSRCALFLSLKYHSLYPHYIQKRIAELKKDFVLRVLLVLVDVEDNDKALLFLNKLAVMSNMTLILAWSEEEAARYLETIQAYDGKDASSIQRREQTNFCDQVADVLGAVRSVNKTDSAQLLEEFSCLKSIVAASVDELVTVHGMGDKKVQRLHDAFHKPFSSRKARKRKEASTVVSNDIDGKKPASMANDEV